MDMNIRGNKREKRKWVLFSDSTIFFEEKNGEASRQDFLHSDSTGSLVYLLNMNILPHSYSSGIWFWYEWPKVLDGGR